MRFLPALQTFYDENPQHLTHAVILGLRQMLYARPLCRRDHRLHVFADFFDNHGTNCTPLLEIVKRNLIIFLNDHTVDAVENRAV